MPATHRNRLVTAISNTPGSTGALTIAAAASGYRTFGAGDDGLSFDVSIVDGTAWEICTGCVYTHAGTSLARGTLEDSSTGSAITLTSAAVVTVTMSAGMGNALEVAMQSITPGGRLTLESGVPISATSQTAKTTIYYTPYVHNTVPLWDGLQWVPTTFAETSLELGTLTSGKPYDVFGYLSAGALVLESLAWTSNTARATAVTLQDGRYCKSGDKSRLLLGTFYTTSTTTTEDSAAKRLVFNTYNREARVSSVSSATSHTYNGTGGVYRYWNNSSANRIELFNGAVSSMSVQSNMAAEGSTTATVYNITAQKLDASNGYDGVPSYTSAASGFGGGSPVVHAVASGWHFIAATETSSASTTFAGFSLSAMVVI
jgi:hypothetical protein